MLIVRFAVREMDCWYGYDGTWCKKKTVILRQPDRMPSRGNSGEEREKKGEKRMGTRGGRRTMAQKGERDQQDQPSARRNKLELVFAREASGRDAHDQKANHE